MEVVRDDPIKLHDYVQNSEDLSNLTLYYADDYYILFDDFDIPILFIHMPKGDPEVHDDDDFQLSEDFSTLTYNGRAYKLSCYGIKV